ncbi:hypothetical protein ACIPY2_08780 [Paenarthrobacter sp. NPDC089675]|uniref:hypothetical protein n=1 Tax=Paenarthrobacter sp. NPDC089675 TaxID=3364376 RepID=UPI00380D3967
MPNDATSEPMPELEGQTSINDFLPESPAITPVEVREPTDVEIAAFLLSADR